MNAPVAYPLKTSTFHSGHKNNAPHFVEYVMQKQQLAVGKC